MYTYVCQSFLLLLTFLFLRALFGKTPRTRAHEARPDLLVDVSARSVYIFWSAWQALRVFFSGGSGGDDLLGFSTRGLILYVRVGKLLSRGLGLFSSHQVRNKYIYKSRFFNAACHTPFAHSPCVCDAPICAVLLWLVVFVGDCRTYFTICLDQVPDVFIYIYIYAHTQAGVCIITSLLPCCFVWIYIPVCDGTRQLLQLCPAKCANSRSRQHTVHTRQMRAALSVLQQ